MTNRLFAKKLFGLTLVGAMTAFTITGCGGNKQEAASEPAAVAEVEAEVVNIKDINAEKYVGLGDYKALKATVLKKEDITDDVVNSYVDYTASAYATTIEKGDDEPAAIGDTVNIDFEGKKDGVAFEGGTSQGYDLLLGSGRFIEGFEDGVVGMKKGETKDLNLTFPDPYASPDLAGADVVFTVKVNSITTSKPAELDDDFVKGLDIEGVATMDQYRTYTKDRLETESQKMYDQRLEEAIMESLLASSTIKETPSWLVDHYFEAREHQQSTYAQMSGMTLEEYANNYFGSTIDEFNSSLRGLAGNDASTLLLVKAVADAEGVTITDGDVDALIQNDIKEGRFENEEDLMEYTGYKRLDYEATALKKKVFGVLRDNADITEVDTYDAMEGGSHEGHNHD